MCYEDIKLGRQIKGRYVRSQGTETIRANGKRVGLWLSADENSAGALISRFANDQIAVAFVANARNDLATVVSSPPVHLSFAELGDLLFGEFDLILQSPAGTVTCVETWLDDGPDFKP